MMETGTYIMDLITGRGWRRNKFVGREKGRARGGLCGSYSRSVLIVVG